MKNNIIIYLNFILLLAISITTGCKKTEHDVTPALETGTVTDHAGNIYKTVKIGNQWWMAENLKTKTYANGNLIPQKQNDNDWSSATDAWCLYDNNTTSPGLLYNYYTVTSSYGLAPNGWHIPTDDEWKQLETHLGMSETEANKLTWRGNTQGNKLKIEGPQGWTNYASVWGTNESGFTALAGSCRLNNGKWGDPGLFATGFWWTATKDSDTEAYYRYLDYKNTNIFRSHAFNNYGMSVRCVKD